MPRRRKLEVDPRLLEKVEDLRRRMRETDREIETALQLGEHLKTKLRKIYAAR